MAKVTALIPAAGAGRRMGGAVAKQYLSLGDRPLLAHTLLVFQHAAVVDEIILILPAEDRERCLRDVVERYRITKVRTIVAGGPERQDSIANGLQSVGEDVTAVLVHDGVRPFATEEMIREAADRACRGECVAVGVPLTDTIKEVDDAGFVRHTLDRSRLWAIQTPQAFPAAVLKRAYAAAALKQWRGTDDAALVERSGTAVRIIRGISENIKITTPEDLVLAEDILRRGNADRHRV